MSNGRHRKISKLLARKPWIRRVNDSDMRWLWAAYRQGIWRDIMSGDLTAQAFEEKARELINSAPHNWIIDAPGTDGLHPVGIILGQNLGKGIEPFVTWFPWATNRNQLEAAAVFLRAISKQFSIFVFAAEDAIRFWTLLKHYGLVRQGCKVKDYFSPGEHAMFYYATRQIAG